MAEGALSTGGRRERSELTLHGEVRRFIRRKCRYHSRCSTAGQRGSLRALRVFNATRFTSTEVLRRSCSDIASAAAFPSRD